MQTNAVFRLLPSGEPPDDHSRSGKQAGKLEAGQEELPYRIELWDEAKRSVEQVLAVTASGSIGYAAFYAATREFVDRYITLRNKNHTLNRWNGPTH